MQLCGKVGYLLYDASRKGESDQTKVMKCCNIYYQLTRSSHLLIGYELRGHG